jgi:hypothetical protein
MEFLSKGTLIVMDGGASKAIEELVAGDKVVTYDLGADDFDMAHIEVNPTSAGVVAEVVSADQESASKIVFDDDTEITATGNYAIYGAFDNDGWISVDGTEIDEDDEDERIGINGKLDVKSEVLPYTDTDSDAAQAGFTGPSSVFVESIESIDDDLTMYSVILENGSTMFANGILVESGKE